MAKYQLTIEVDETQLKQNYLSQDKNLTEKDLPSPEEIIKKNFNCLVDSEKKIIGTITPIEHPKNEQSLSFAQLKSQYEALHYEYLKLLMENTSLRHHHQDLLQLIDSLTEDRGTPPSFL